MSSMPIQFDTKNERGPVYKCLPCGHLNEKRRVVSHIYKVHVQQDRYPFYCSLCGYWSTKEQELVNHIQPGKYAPHQQALEDKLKQNIPVDYTLMLMKSLNPKYLVEGVDYMRLPPTESAIIWHQRKRPVATPVAAPAPCARVSPVVENVLDSILDYDPNERITPAPVTPTAVTTVEYSPQMQDGQTYRGPIYVPTARSFATTLTSPSQVSPLNGLATPMAGSSEASLVPSQTQTLTPHTPTLVETGLHFGSNLVSEPLPSNRGYMAVPSSHRADVLKTPPLGNPTQVFGFTSGTEHTGASFPNLLTTLVNSEGIQTKTDDAVQLPVLHERAEHNSMTPVREEHSATPAPPPSSYAAKQDSGPTSMGNEVAEAIKAMTSSLVEAMSKQTFQIEMLRATLSAYLRRADERDNERKYPVNLGMRKSSTFSRRRSVTPMPSPAKLKRQLSSSVVIPAKKKK